MKTRLILAERSQMAIPKVIKTRAYRSRIIASHMSRRAGNVSSHLRNGIALRYQATTALAVVFVSSLVTFRLCISHLAPTFDEGIYFYGAERLLSGQQIYRDFFLFTGPGTPWLFAGLFKLFGPSFAAAHGVLALEIGLITGALYWIAARLSTKVVGLAAATSFLTLLIPFSHRLYVNHRWDSCCCTILAVAFLLYSPEKRLFVELSGLLAGIAAVFTPPTLWAGLAITICLLIKPQTRKLAAWFAGAACIPLAIAVAVLASQGVLSPTLTSFRWAGEHYRKANSVFYGFSAEAPNIAHKLSRVELFIFEIPALLPPVGLFLLAAMRLKRVRIPYTAILLAAAGLGMVASCYPRWSADQLLFAAPLFFALLFVLASIKLRPNVVRLASIAISAFGCLIILDALAHIPPAVPVSTQLGEVACTYRDQPNVDFATSVIQPGTSLFVYPYQPIWYSLTGGVNPTRFNFLQPGMMTLKDEGTALRELMAHPPQWVIWHKLTPQMVLTIWPNSDRSTLQFKRIENWIRANYTQVAPPNPHYRYAIAIFHKI